MKSITYATYGNKKIRARGTSLGSYAECEFDMLIKTQPGNEHFNYIQPDMSIPLKVEDFQPPLNGYYSVDEYDGKPHGGCATAHIRFANKQLQYDIPISQNKLPYLCNPVIFVEGLDLSPYPICNPDNGKPIRYGDFGWDIFTLGTSENSPHTGTGSFDQMKLLPEQLKKFQESGRDIILLDFCDGADYIQLNSLLLQKLIIEVNKMKLGCSNPSPNTVIGASMGGMVSRHALSSMEKAMCAMILNSMFLLMHHIRELIFLLDFKLLLGLLQKFSQTIRIFKTCGKHCIDPHQDNYLQVLWSQKLQMEI